MPAAPVVLLLLFVHAFVVSATHIHRFERGGALKAQTGVSLGSREDSNPSTEAGGHAQCLLCRLQRNFVTDYHKTTLPAGPPHQKTLASGPSPAFSLVTRPYSVPAGRAPPLA